MDALKVTQFQGQYRFLSNFYPAEIPYQGLTYPSVENAYQAAKTTVASERIPFTMCPPNVAKQLGRKLYLRDDWDDVKLDVMEVLVLRKFQLHANLRTQLLLTGGMPLEEGNTWGDKFWGIYMGRGENHLGKILMRIRDELMRAALNT